MSERDPSLPTQQKTHTHHKTLSSKHSRIAPIEPRVQTQAWGLRLLGRLPFNHATTRPCPCPPSSTASPGDPSAFGFDLGKLLPDGFSFWIQRADLVQTNVAPWEGLPVKIFGQIGREHGTKSMWDPRMTIRGFDQGQG